MQLIKKGNWMNSIKLMHSKIRGIGPTLSCFFEFDMNFLEQRQLKFITNLSQIYLNLTEILEDRQESLFGMKTRWKALKIGIH